MAVESWLRLARHRLRRAAWRALLSAGKRIETSRAMMAITTSNSMRVNAGRGEDVFRIVAPIGMSTAREPGAEELGKPEASKKSVSQNRPRWGRSHTVLSEGERRLI